MKTLVRKKKIFYEWYEYLVEVGEDKKSTKVIASINHKQLAPNLYSVSIKSFKIDIKTNKEVEYDIEYLINKNDEILIEDVLKISRVGNYWPFFILELDGLSKNWKKFVASKSQRLFMIIDDNGAIVNGPTTKNIKYIPSVDIVVVGEDIFNLRRNQENDDGDTLTELIEDNTFIITKGSKKGLIFGQAYWNNNENLWNQYANIGLFPLPYDSITAYPTFIQNLFILKLDDKFSFYKVERSLMCINSLSKKMYKEIKKLYNNFLNRNIGFVCIKEDNSIDFYSNFDDFISLETKNEHEAISKILDFISDKYDCKECNFTYY